MQSHSNEAINPRDDIRASRRQRAPCGGHTAPALAALGTQHYRVTRRTTPFWAGKEGCVDVARVSSPFVLHRFDQLTVVKRVVHGHVTYAAARNTSLHTLARVHSCLGSDFPQQQPRRGELQYPRRVAKTKKPGQVWSARATRRRLLGQHHQRPFDNTLRFTPRPQARWKVRGVPIACQAQRRHRQHTLTA
jgi:hypothetical protein